MTVAISIFDIIWTRKQDKIYRNCQIFHAIVTNISFRMWWKKTKRSTQMNGWIYIGWEITNLFSFTGLEIETLFCFIWFSPNVHELYGNWCMYSIRSTSYHARNRNSSSLISRPEKYYARLFVWIQYFIVKLLCNYSSLFLWASQFTMNSSNNLLFGISDCSHWSWREAI